MLWVSGDIHTETKPYPILKLNIIIFDYMMRLMKLNLQILMCILGIVGHPGVSWGVLGDLGCPGVIRLTAHEA